MRLGKHLEKKTDNWSVGSKKKLTKAVEHKMKRIYVGLLDALDKEVNNGTISKDTAALLRAKVLNIGNDQIRNMGLELDKYNIEFIAYHIEIRNPEGVET
jgi:adenosyl cobinamide kinase/adenosyl cobinamide phosphate guanylyltransferase